MTVPATESLPAPVPSPDQLPKLASAVLGGGLLVYGLRRRGVLGALIGAAGMGLLAGALAEPTERIVRRAGDARRGAVVRHTFEVSQPIRDVFAFFGNFEHFPAVAPSIESIVDFRDGRSRWCIRTGSGELLEWDALVTKYVPNQVLGWESLPGSPVDSTGLVRFAPLGPELTRVELTLTFTPEEGTFSDALRALVATPLSSRLRRDLSALGLQVERWAAERLVEPA